MGTDVQGEPARRRPALGKPHPASKRGETAVHHESPPGLPGPHGAQPHLLRCSISACFSRSSLKAEARRSSSCSAPVPAGYASARLGRAYLKEGGFLLELHKILANYLTKPYDEVENTQCKSRASGPAAPWACEEGAALHSHPPSRQVTPGLWALNRPPLSNLDVNGRRAEEVSKQQA